MNHITFFFFCVLVIEIRATREFPVNVERRGNGDLVTVFTADSTCKNLVCASNRTTYLLDDGACLNDAEILSKFCQRKSYLAVPRESFGDISVVIGSDGLLRARDKSSSSYQVAQIFDRRGHQLSETGRCTVHSLKVIRSRDKGVSIDHRGFAIVSSNHDLRVQVRRSDSVYSLEEYAGEVFQLTFSCTHSPGRICIVFKVNGSVSYWKGKFRKIIPQPPDTWNACPQSSFDKQLMTTAAAKRHVNTSLLGALLGSLVGLTLLISAVTIVALQIYIQHKKLSTERTATVAGHGVQLHPNLREQSMETLNRSSLSLSTAGSQILIQTSNDPLQRSRLWNIFSKNSVPKQSKSQGKLKKNFLDKIELVEL